MYIDIRGHHVEITKPIRDYVEEKLHRIMDHDFGIMSINIILKVAKDNQKAEGIVKFRGKKEIFIDEITQDMYESIDKLADKLVRKVHDINSIAKKHARNKSHFPSETSYSKSDKQKKDWEES